MQLFDQGDATYEARRQILIEQREIALEKLQRVQEGLDRLDYKIAHYDELIAGRGTCVETCPNQKWTSPYNALGPLALRTVLSRGQGGRVEGSYLKSPRCSCVQESAQIEILAITIAATIASSPPTGSQPVEKGLALPGTARSHSA